MNILWLSPFNVRSAIGIFSREVCVELRKRGHNVRVMRTESGAEADLPVLFDELPILGPDDAVPQDLDLIVVNYGNHAPYHAGALRIASQYPSVAIFHDAEMRHFEWGMVDRHGLALPRLVNDVVPDNGVGPSTDLVDPEARPVLEVLSAMAIAAVVHGPHYQATIAAACPGPVKVLPLCYPQGEVKHPQQQAKSRPIVTIFGIISPYKQPERLMRAAYFLKQAGILIDINLAGPIEDDYRKQLSSLAQELHISEPIFHGYLSDDDLFSLLASSDAVCCLRYPVTEGGSASLVTALYQGRPVIVSDIASFSMIPDDMVIKVSYGDQSQDLANALQRIIDFPDTAFNVAAKAREWAITNFSATAYVDNLEPVLRQAIFNLPIVKAARILSQKAVSPSGEPTDKILISMARSLNEIFSFNSCSQGPIS